MHGHARESEIAAPLTSAVVRRQAVAGIRVSTYSLLDRRANLHSRFSLTARRLESGRLGCITRVRRLEEGSQSSLAADGRIVWLRDIVSLVIVDDQVTRLRGIMVDVTDRKRAEAALTLLRSLLDHTNDAIEIIDRKPDVFWTSSCLA